MGDTRPGCYGFAMNSSEGATALLNGPRGRRLCLALVDGARLSYLGAFHRNDDEPALRSLARELEAAISATDLTAISSTTDELALLGALSQSVDAAKYWQEPDDEDRFLSHPEIYNLLEPVAQSVADSPAAQWWSTGVDIDGQQHTEWVDGHGGGAPPLSGSREELAGWRLATDEDEERSKTRPEDPSASFSGNWWSTPIPSRLICTTRGLPGLGAVNLVLTEDSFGWTRARCWPIRPNRPVTIFEIWTQDDWVDLVGRYPLNVSRSRRHDWWKATGLASAWLIPDWVAVASDYDAVHLTVNGYLTTAGRALPVVDSCHTVLAGWDPDQTIWLTDSLTGSGAPTEWHVDQAGHVRVIAGPST